MNMTPRIRLVASGLLLVAFGFFCGLLSGGPRERTATPHGRLQAGYAVAPMQGRHYSQAVAWRSDYPGSTVVIVRQEQPVQIAISAPDYQRSVGIAAPPSPTHNDSRTGLWLALLLALGVGPLTYFALNWRREQRNHAFGNTDPYMETFVPRRDD